jgi:membrane-bound serine protease (ClpP class)
VQEQEHTLQTRNLTVERVIPDWRNKLLSIISSPNVAYILMLIGIYGLILEFYNPGAILPGVTGAICLILALFAFQLLPVDYTGLALMLLGIALMVAEAFAPSFGVLGIGGVIAFVIGSIILMDTDSPGYRVSYSIIAAFALTSFGFFTLIMGMFIRQRRRPVVSGREEMLGAVGEALEDFTGSGHVHVHGESWNAVSRAPLSKGQKVRVEQLDGLVLVVSPVNEEEA